MNDMMRFRLERELLDADLFSRATARVKTEDLRRLLYERRPSRKALAPHAFVQLEP